jgi:glycosyltransferase involved in cell wall biosynthesis
VVRVSLNNRYLYEIRMRLVLFWQMLRHRQILVNGLADYIAPLARLLRRKYVLKVVGDAVWEQGRNRGDISLDFDSFQQQRSGNLSAQRRALQQASRIITPSRYMEKVVKDWGYVPADRISTIENGVPLEDFAAHVPAPSTGALDVLFIGRLTNWKGVETILLALQGVDGIRFTILGDGPEKPLLQTLARQLGVTDKVGFEGKMEQAELHARMKEAHVLVLPSCYEGMSHTLLEAGAAGLARLASDIGGNAEIIRNGEDGLLLPYGDVAAWRTALEKLREDDALRLKLAKAGQESVRQHDFAASVGTWATLLQPEAGNRVVHLMPFYDVPGKAAFSGAEHHLFTLMQGQVKAGWQVELVMVVGLDGPRLHEKAEELRTKGIAVTLVTYPVARLGLWPKLARVLIVPKLATLLRQWRECVLHIHPVTGSGGLIALAAWLAGCRKVVVSYHNNAPKLAQFPYRTGLRLIDRVAKRTIGISEVVVRHLVNNVGLSPERTRVVYYGVDMPEKQPDRVALRQRLGLADGFLVGLVGRLTPEKDIPTFLKAMSLIPDVPAVIIGGGTIEAELKAEASRLNLKNVTFAGAQPDGPDLIGCLDLMVLPSRFEGLGLVLLEAMVRHVPIVGSTGGAIPEITEQGRLGRLFPVGDARALADAILALRDAADERQNLAETAYACAVEKYTVPVMVAKTVQLYEEAKAA